VIFKKTAPTPPAPKYPGIPTAVNGTTAVVEMETAASEGGGAYPITPSTQMGEAPYRLTAQKGNGGKDESLPPFPFSTVLPPYLAVASGFRDTAGVTVSSTTSSTSGGGGGSKPSGGSISISAKR